MSDDGETKDDVKAPEGEVGEKIDKLFRVEEKDTSELSHHVNLLSNLLM
jgi:translation initiation factor 5A